jgi:hypothetical protein
MVVKENIAYYRTTPECRTRFAWSYNLRALDAFGKEALLTDSKPSRLFLMSPPDIMGIRGRQIMKDCAQSDLHMGFRNEGVLLGDLFTFISELSFRGKLAYARAFARSPNDLAGAYVITACGGLIPPEKRVTLELMREICAGDVDPANVRYCRPFTRDLHILSELAGPDCQIGMELTYIPVATATRHGPSPPSAAHSRRGDTSVLWWREVAD